MGAPSSPVTRSGTGDEGAPVPPIGAPDIYIDHSGKHDVYQVGWYGKSGLKGGACVLVWNSPLNGEVADMLSSSPLYVHVEPAPCPMSPVEDEGNSTASTTIPQPQHAEMQDIGVLPSEASFPDDNNGTTDSTDAWRDCRAKQEKIFIFVSQIFIYLCFCT